MAVFCGIATWPGHGIGSSFGCVVSQDGLSVHCGRWAGVSVYINALKKRKKRSELFLLMICQNCKTDTHATMTVVGDDGQILTYCNECPRSEQEAKKFKRFKGHVIYRPHFGAPKSVRQRRFDKF